MLKGNETERIDPRWSPAAMRSSVGRTVDFVATYLILIVLFLLMAALFASLAGWAFPQSDLVIQVLLGGFIGGVTNKIAISMLFEKSWYLPGSGVLLKKHREIVRSLAATVEAHLINSEMLQEELRKLLRPIRIEKVEQVLNQVIDEFRDDVRQYLRSAETRRQITDALRTKLGFLGRFLNITGIKEYEEMADTVISELDGRIRDFRVTKQMIVKSIQRIGTLEDFFFRPGNEILRRHYGTDKPVAQLLFERIQIRKMVTERLSSYEPSQVKDIIEANIRAHLLWLEVFGVFLGMIFSGGLALLLQSFRI